MMNLDERAHFGIQRYWHWGNRLTDALVFLHHAPDRFISREGDPSDERSSCAKFAKTNSHVRPL